MIKRFVFAVLIILSLTGCFSSPDENKMSIDSFEACEAAGYPVMESFPRQCKVDDGETFVEKLEQEQIIGGQRDEHYCLSAAGYSFDEEINACVRVWEIKDDAVRAAAKAAVEQVGKQDVTVVAVSNLTCPGCFEVELDTRDGRQTVKLNGLDPVGDHDVRPEPKALDETQARAAAEKGKCTDEGVVGDLEGFNEGTNTWWFKLKTERKGCNPACVVDAETAMSEVNWRCTGLVFN